MCSSTATTVRAAASRRASSPAPRVILYALVFGLARAHAARAGRRWSRPLVPLGVLIYAGVGVAGLLHRRQLPRLLPPRPRSGPRPGVGRLPGRARRLRHRRGDHGRDLLRLRRAGAADERDLDRAATRRPLQPVDHRLPDGRRALHRHRPRQHDQEAGRPVAVPDLGLSPLHLGREDPRRHRADRRRRASPSTPIRCRTSSSSPPSSSASRRWRSASPSSSASTRPTAPIEEDEIFDRDEDR